MRAAFVTALGFAFALMSCKNDPKPPPRTPEIIVASGPSQSAAIDVNPDSTATSPPPPAGPIAANCVGITLEIVPQTNHGYTTFVGTLTNKGTKTVSLVEAGDGSDVGWRTPIITWEVKTLSGQDVPKEPVARCGNVNSISESEIFTLAPGDMRSMTGWFGAPFVKPGKYVVKATYENDPKKGTHGIPLGTHESAALEKIAKSTACKVESNAVTVDLSRP